MWLWSLVSPETAVVAVVLMSPLPPIVVSRGGEFALVYVVFLIALALRVAVERRRLALPPIVLPLGLFVIVTVGAVLRAAPAFSTSPELWTTGVGRPVLYLSLAAVGAYFGSYYRRPRPVTLIATAVIILAMSAYLQRLGLYELPFSAAHGVKRYGGLMITGNGLAAFLAPYMVLLLPQVDSPDRRARTLVRAAIIVGVPALVLSLSRGGLLAFCAVGLVWLLFFAKLTGARRLALVALLSITIVGLLALPAVSQYWSQFMDYYASGDLGAVTQGRTVVWSGIGRYLLSPGVLLFGGGLDDYVYRVSSLTTLTRSFAVHSMVLRTLVDNGLVGLGATVWAVAAALRATGGLKRGSWRTGLSAGLLLFVAAWAIFGIAGDIPLADRVMGPFWYAVGFAWAESLARCDVESST